MHASLLTPNATVAPAPEKSATALVHSILNKPLPGYSLLTKPTGEYFDWPLSTSLLVYSETSDFAWAAVVPARVTLGVVVENTSFLLSFVLFFPWFLLTLAIDAFSRLSKSQHQPASSGA